MLISTSLILFSAPLDDDASALVPDLVNAAMGDESQEVRVSGRKVVIGLAERYSGVYASTTSNPQKSTVLTHGCGFVLIGVLRSSIVEHLTARLGEALEDYAGSVRVEAIRMLLECGDSQGGIQIIFSARFLLRRKYPFLWETSLLLIHLGFLSCFTGAH